MDSQVGDCDSQYLFFSHYRIITVDTDRTVFVLINDVYGAPLHEVDCSNMATTVTDLSPAQ